MCMVIVLWLPEHVISTVVYFIALFIHIFCYKNVHSKFECAICLFLPFIHENGIRKIYRDLKNERPT